MAGIEEAFENFVKRISSQEEPQDEYGDPQTGEKTIPLIQGMIPGYSYENTMPNYYNRQPYYQQEIANGGVANLFKKRKPYADGGTYPTSAIAPNGIEYELKYSPFSGKPFYQPKFDASRNDLVYYGIDPEEFFKTVMSTGTSTPTTTEIPTVDPFSGQPTSKQDIMDILEQLKPPTPEAGWTEEGLLKNAEDAAARQQAIIDALNNSSINNIPTVDPFYDQQVSAQDQLAFTQPQQEIFPRLNLGSSDPLTNILGNQIGNLSYSEMNALRNKSPNILETNVEANLLKGLGTGLKDFAYVGDKLGSDYYKNLTGNFFENIKNLDKGFSYDPSYTGADKTGRLGYYAQGIKSLLGINTPGSNVGGGTPGMRYAIEKVTPYLSKTIGPVLNVLGSTPVTALGVLDTLTGPANASEVGKGPEYFREQLKLQNSPVASFNEVKDPRFMMSDGGLTKTVPPVRGPDPQGVESLFKGRYN